VRDAKRIARPRELIGNGAAGRNKLGARDLTGKHRCVTAAEPTEAGDADAKTGYRHRDAQIKS